MRRYLTPEESRKAFAERGWKRIVAFQTRNPIHRAHEYLTKVALEIVDGLFIHPLVGETKTDDIPADVRMRCYEVLMERLLPRRSGDARRLPGGDALRGPARGDLPRDRPPELRLHPLHRRAATTPASATTTAPTTRSRSSTSSTSTSSAITPLFFEHTFWCNECEGMASAKTCPHAAGVASVPVRHQGARDARRAARSRRTSSRGTRLPRS